MQSRSLLIVDGSSLSASDIAAAARSVEAVSLSAAARARARVSWEFATAVALSRPIYGRSTGVGANRTVAVDDPAGQALRLLRSHATSAGPLRSEERIRAMLIVRLNQLAVGGSGIDPSVLDALAGSIGGVSVPAVREWGSVGTADLSALAVTAVWLMRKGSGSGTAEEADGGEELSFGAGDALPFISSNAATVADAALALVDLRESARAAIGVSALTFAGVGGSQEAFSELAVTTTPFAGARSVGSAMRRLIRDVPAARIQDPFALRTLPQVHGAFLDALDRLDLVVTVMANAAAENPVFSAPAGVAHHGGFHAVYLAQALDAAVLAAAQSAQLSLARLGLLVEPAFTGLTTFLADSRAGSSGVMVLEYVAASALGSLRALAQPAGLQSVTISRGVEDDASFASLAARQALDAVAVYRTVLACELVAAVRCLRMKSALSEQVSLGAALARLIALGDGLDQELADRDLTADIAAAAAQLPNFGAQMDA